MTNFADFNLSVMLQDSLEQMGYETPTPIQEQAIPLALEGKDVMGSAQTGTGKTAAYSIPIIEFLLTNPKGSALVLTPTRELGKQVMEILHQLLGKKSAINTAFLIGGAPMGKQYAQLTKKPRLIVGTPGRINDHLDRGNIHMKDMQFLVLDETDRMLDMGFSVQIDAILRHMPQKRQTLMFSATMPDDIVRMAKNYMNNPERVSVGSTTNPIENIKQEVLHVKDHEKYEKLCEQLDEREGSVIIFVKTKYGTEKLAKRLNNEAGYEFHADAIHGDLKQTRRDRVIKKMRAQEFRILVATDVVARGLDIPHIEHVINYDLPQVPEDYIHRIGRTARAGAKGSALCLITPADGRKWSAIEMLMDPEKAHTGGKVYRGQGDGKKRRRPDTNRPRRNSAGGYKGKDSSGGKPAYGKKPSNDRYKKPENGYGSKNRASSDGEDRNNSYADSKRVGIKKRNNDRDDRNAGATGDDKARSKSKYFGGDRGKSFGDKKTANGRSKSSFEGEGYKGKNVAKPGSKTSFEKRNDENKSSKKKKPFRGGAKADSKGGVKTGPNTGYRKPDNASAGARKSRPFNKNGANKGGQSRNNANGSKPRTRASS